MNCKKVHFLVPALLMLCAAFYLACAKKSSSDSGGGGSTKIIFVTSLIYSGNLGGLSGADAKCSLRAQAGGLSGSWKAWLSDANNNAIDRITDVGPWVDTKGTTIFNNKSGMTGYPIDVSPRN